MSLLAVAASAAFVMSGCAWHDTNRVDSDFGHSVRQMVAEQIVDLEAAHEPAVYGPSAFSGNVADSSVSGYEKAASEARVQREKNTRSPIPIVGIISGTEE